jgi:hypothetical protein
VKFGQHFEFDRVCPYPRSGAEANSSCFFCEATWNKDGKIVSGTFCGRPPRANLVGSVANARFARIMKEKTEEVTGTLEISEIKQQLSITAKRLADIRGSL